MLACSCIAPEACSVVFGTWRGCNRSSSAAVGPTGSSDLSDEYKCGGLTNPSTARRAGTYHRAAEEGSLLTHRENGFDTPCCTISIQLKPQPYRAPLSRIRPNQPTVIASVPLYRTHSSVCVNCQTTYFLSNKIAKYRLCWMEPPPAPARTCVRARAWCNSSHRTFFGHHIVYLYPHQLGLLALCG